MNAPALIEPTLDALAAEINAAHTEAQAFSSQAVERAHDAGIRLNQAKAQCQHGDWLPWLAEHCPAVSERTARAYMQLARDWKALENKTAVTADLTLDAALKLLSAPKPAKKSAQKHLPATPAKTAVTADLTKPEPLRPVSKPGAFEAALALGPLAQFDAVINAPSEPEPTLDLGFLDQPPIDDGEQLRAECEQLRDELAKITRSRDFWQRKVRDKETRAAWAKEDEEQRAYMEQLKVENPADYQKIQDGAAERAGLFAKMFDLKQAMPLEIWRRLVQLSHPDKHGGSLAAVEASQWLLENRPSRIEGIPNPEAQP